MSVPDDKIEEAADGSLTVRVGRGAAGRFSENAESLGLWVVHDPEGRFVGRHLDPKDGARFLAAWFVRATRTKNDYRAAVTLLRALPR